MSIPFPEQVARLDALAERLRAVAPVELLRDAIDAARAGWVSADIALTTGAPIDPDCAARFDRALTVAAAAPGAPPEFGARMRWYQLLLRAGLRGARDEVSEIIARTRDGLILGRAFPDIVAELGDPVPLVVSAAVPG